MANLIKTTARSKRTTMIVMISAVLVIVLVALGVYVGFAKSGTLFGAESEKTQEDEPIEYVERPEDTPVSIDAAKVVVPKSKSNYGFTVSPSDTEQPSTRVDYIVYSSVVNRACDGLGIVGSVDRNKSAGAVASKDVNGKAIYFHPVDTGCSSNIEANNILNNAINEFKKSFAEAS